MTMTWGGVIPALTTAFRADAPEVRALLAAGESIVGGGDPTKVQAIACH